MTTAAVNSMPDYATLALERPREHVLCVRLNRPEAMNALNTQMGRDLLDLWTRLGAEPGDLRCIVLTGTGDRAFCAGADLKERRGMSDDVWRAQHEIFERAFMAHLDCGVPVIGAVNGDAYGGGLEMAMCCDFIYAASEARFAQSEVRLGIMPGCMGTQNLPRALGARRAKELLFTARPFSAAEAADWGLVNKVCTRAALIEESLQCAQAIAANAPLAVRQAKKSAHYGLAMDLLTGYRFELEAYYRLVTTEDRLEGIRAFNEKRTPVFRGR